MKIILKHRNNDIVKEFEDKEAFCNYIETKCCYNDNFYLYDSEKSAEDLYDVFFRDDYMLISEETLEEEKKYQKYTKSGAYTTEYNEK